MFPTSHMNNIGACFAGLYGGIDANTVTAGTGGDGAAQNGKTIDRTALAGGLHQSAKLQLPVKAVLGQSETCTIDFKVQDSADGTTWTDYTYRATGATGGSVSKVFTGGNGGTTETGVVELDVDLSGARKYVRGVATANLSRANTDTCLVGPLVWNFGGGSDLPARV